MSIDYRSWYQNAKAELLKLQEEKAELGRALADHDRQIAALIQTMNAIAPLLGEEPLESDTPPPGMTDSIRGILAEAKEPLSAAEIRDRLAAMGFDLNSYSNPLATIHTVLKRLVESGEAEMKEADGAKRFAPAGKRGYVMGLTIGRASREQPLDLVAGKSFAIGKEWKGVIGVGRLTRRKRGAAGK
jgi:hypothetical protein